MTSKRKTLSRRTFVASAISVPFIAKSAFAQAKEPFAFGVALPTTGSAAPFGVDQIQALEWGIADVNAKGGANGRMLKPIVLDTQANPQIGIDIVTRLISVDKVQLISTGFSSVIAAVAPIVNRSKVLTFVTGAVSPRIAQMGDYVYTTYPLADVDVTLLAKYARQELKLDKAAVIYLNDESGIYGARVYKDNFEKLGGKIVAFESYEPNATDYTGALLKLRASGPQVVHLQGNAGDSPQVMRQIRQFGITVPVTSYTAAYNPNLVKQLGTAADGLIVASMAPGATDSKDVAAYVERWKKEKGREAANLPATQYFYDQAQIIKGLVEKCDQVGEPLTGDNLRKALLSIKKFDLPLTGPVEFRDDHTVQKPVYLMEVKNAVYTPLRRYE
jgi:branched-chain amino acid transport system substrate-binding protein